MIFFSVGAEKIMCLFSVGNENILFCFFVFVFVLFFFRPGIQGLVVLRIYF